MPGQAEFNAIVDRFAGRVYNHAFRMLNNREDAEEAVQDVFLRVHRSLERFRGESELSTWIWRITVNVCLSRRGGRKSGRRVQFMEHLPHDVADDTPGAEEMLIAEEDRTQLAGLIARLPDREAAAITLYYLEGFDYAEIAAVLKIPPGSVATALHRGRERLGRWLREERPKVKK